MRIFLLGAVLWCQVALAQGSPNTHALESEAFFVNGASMVSEFGVDPTRVIQNAAASRVLKKLV